MPLKKQFKRMALYALITVLMSGCAYINLQRGVYDSTRSRELSSPAAQSGRQTLPAYDQYERERADLRSGASNAPAAAASSSKP